MFPVDVYMCKINPLLWLRFIVHSQPHVIPEFKAKMKRVVKKNM